MQFNNIPPFVRFIFAAAMFALYFFAMVEWEWLNPIISFSKFVIYLLVGIWGILTGAVCYALLPTKKVVDLSITVIKSKGKKDRVVGYWLWLGCFVVVYWVFLAIYINEI